MLSALILKDGWPCHSSVENSIQFHIFLYFGQVNFRNLKIKEINDRLVVST